MRNCLTLLLLSSFVLRGAVETPANFRAAAPFTNSASVELAWVDQSDGETGFELEISDDGVTGWSVVSTSAPNQTRLTLSGGGAGGVFFFRLRALDPDDDHSPFTDPISVTLPTTVAIVSGLFDGGQVGTAISAPTPNALRAPGETGAFTFSAEGLPDGFTVDSGTGVVSGTPTQAGLFRPLLIVNDGTSTASTFVTLRIVEANSNPTVKDDLVLLPLSSLSYTFGTDTLFCDQDTQEAVRIVTNEGDIDVILYPKAAPITVNNFLSYVDADAYRDVMFHRAVTAGLSIIQAGLFKPDSAGGSDDYTTITTSPAIINEPGLPNARGTIAPAKTANPDSATSQWFFNTIDNSGPLNSPSNSGGFSVYGRATTLSLPVLDLIQGRPTGTYPLNLNGSATSLADWPTKGVPSGASPDPLTDLIQIESTTRISPVSASLGVGSNSGVVTASVVDDEIVLETNQGGHEDLAFDLTDLDGNTASVSVQVYVLDFDVEATSGDGEVGQFSFSHFKVSPGFQYRVQTSRDLQSWDSFWTTAEGFAVPELLSQEDQGDEWRLTFAVPLPAGSEEPLFFRVVGEEIPSN